MSPKPRQKIWSLEIIGFHYVSKVTQINSNSAVCSLKEPCSYLFLVLLVRLFHFALF